MNQFLNHIQTAYRCVTFIAPRCTFSPMTVPPQEEFIEILTGGEVLFERNGKLQLFKKGTIFWHIAGEKTIHQSPGKRPYHCLVIKFKVNEKKRTAPRVFHWQNIIDLDIFTGDILQLWHTPNLDNEFFCNYVLTNIMRQNIMPSPKPIVHDLQKACNFINNNLMSKIDVCQIARETGMSRTTLFRKFKEQLNCSPYEYLSKQRLEMAATLLKNQKDLPIKMIAAMCGFQNIEVFYRQFLRYKGNTPKEYRQN